MLNGWKRLKENIKSQQRLSPLVFMTGWKRLKENIKSQHPKRPFFNDGGERD